MFAVQFSTEGVLALANIYSLNAVAGIIVILSPVWNWIGMYVTLVLHQCIDHAYVLKSLVSFTSKRLIMMLNEPTDCSTQLHTVNTQLLWCYYQKPISFI